MVTRGPALAAFALIAAAGCRFDGGAFDERACTSEADCRPDQDCVEGLCAQIATCDPGDPGPVILPCGSGYQFSCDADGGCVARDCTGEAQCAQGYTCTGGFCALDCVGLDADSDAICDNVDNCPNDSNVEQTNSDTDALGDACDDCDLDPDNDTDDDDVCGDLDNCPFDANTNQLDTDSDLAGNICDADDDNDGLLDVADPEPLDPDLCGDADTDTCDDCAVGTDGFGPLPDRDVANDGDDADGDGRCNDGETDDDNDGRLDGVDACPTGDTGWTSTAGTDFDGDGCRDAGEDTDDDNDGVDDASDPAPENPDQCGDGDGDTCNDCVVGTDGTGPLSDALPDDDGPDTDGDGACNAGDPDDDNDGGPDTVDPDDADPQLCGLDADGDTCDDCTGGVDGLGPLPDSAPGTDGPDGDGDGACTAGDCDDERPHCTLDCTDVDGDDYCGPLDCDDCLATCTADCATNTDGDSAADCVETFCGSNPALATSVCRIATSEATLQTAIMGANSANGADYILLDASFTVANQLPGVNDAAGLTVRQCEGTAVTLSHPTIDRVLFDLNSGNNTIDGVDLIGGTNANIMIRLDGSGNTVVDSSITGYEKNAIYVTGAASLIANNRISGGTQASALGVGAIAISGNNSDATVIVGNVITNTAHDGINIEDADATFVDHNTIAFNGGDGVDWTGTGTGATDNCMRNNIVSHNVGAGLRQTGTLTFNTTPGGPCLAPLVPAGNPGYGNDQFTNTGGACAGTSCASCACVPGGASGANFWEFTVDPQYVTTTPSSPQAYCLASASALIDAMDSLGYDVNGDDAGLFNPTAPDGGGREAGSDSCPAP
jgi:hypothetical protein